MSSSEIAGGQGKDKQWVVSQPVTRQILPWCPQLQQTPFRASAAVLSSLQASPSPTPAVPDLSALYIQALPQSSPDGRYLLFRNI